MKLHGDEDVELSYKYMMNMDSDLAIQNNMLIEDSAYEWAPKRWSYCSKPCGGGTVSTRKTCPPARRLHACLSVSTFVKFSIPSRCREAVPAIRLQKKSRQ